MKFCVLVFLLCLHSITSKSPRLDHYNVNADQISISGLSSGAFFSVQFHVAFSSTIIGAGIVAGGPYWCANDNLEIALSSCMLYPESISVQELINITYATALSLTIDKPSNLRNDKVYLFSGTKDTVVVPGVVHKLAEYYSHFTPNGVTTQFHIPAEHSMVTDDYGNNCGILASPFINNCGYQTADYILQHIYGDIEKANSSHAEKEHLLEFDQSEFFEDVPKLVSMDSTGYVYVPKDCQDGQKKCRLHIALHGCMQGRVSVSTDFAWHAGYNGLAEVNNIIVLYPQVVKSPVTPYNPNGCWDWWGYSGPSYASKIGPQMAGVKLMLNRIVD